MKVDESFIKSLKTAVRPEFIISEKIWSDWFILLKESQFLNQKILDVAKSNKLFWPPSKSEDTFGFYLNKKFSEIKEILGNDAKYTLIICLAEKIKILSTDIFNANEMTDRQQESVSCDVEFHAKNEMSYRGFGQIREVCEVAAKLTRNMQENNQIGFSLIERLQKCLLDIESHNFSYIENVGMYEKDRNNQISLLKEVIQISKDQINDINNLKLENRKILDELESVKSEFAKIKKSHENHSASNSCINDNFIAKQRTRIPLKDVKMPVINNTSNKMNLAKYDLNSGKIIPSNPDDFDDIKI